MRLKVVWFDPEIWISTVSDKTPNLNSTGGWGDEEDQVLEGEGAKSKTWYAALILTQNC